MSKEWRNIKGHKNELLEKFQLLLILLHQTTEDGEDLQGKTEKQKVTGVEKSGS